MMMEEKERGLVDWYIIQKSYPEGCEESEL